MVKLFNELPEFHHVENLFNQLIKNKYFSIDFLRPYVMYHYGGLYMDTDFVYLHSVRFLHTFLDFYSGSEGTMSPGVAAGIFGVRPKHQIMKDWLDFLLGYYGLTPDVFGTRDLMPMPAFRDDTSWTSGLRGLGFAVWKNLDKWGNNDAIFKVSMLNMDASHHNWGYQKFYGFIYDDNPRRESITLGGTKYHFE